MDKPLTEYLASVANPKKPEAVQIAPGSNKWPPIEDYPYVMLAETGGGGQLNPLVTWIPTCFFANYAAAQKEGHHAGGVLLLRIR